MPRVDYAAIEERDFSPVPDGIYEAVFTAWELRDGQKGPYYNLEFTASDPELNGRKFWTMTSISPGGLWAFKRTMVALGADPEDMAPGSEVDTDEIVASVMGADCRLALKKEVYPSKKTGKDEERSAVEEVLAPLPF